MEEWLWDVVKAVGVITIVWYAAKMWKWSVWIIVKEYKHLKVKGMEWTHKQWVWWKEVVREVRK